MTGDLPAPSVSLGLPVYNGAEYVDEAIGSILAQDHADFELIISDNGSTDDTSEICRAYAQSDPRIRYHRQPTNRGASFNFGFVAGQARGALFKWAAHDDVLEPQYLKRCVEILHADPEVVLCHTAIAEIDEQGEIFRYTPHRRFAEQTSPAARFADVLLRAGATYHSLGVVRTHILRRTPLLAPYSSSDMPLLAELALYGRFHEIPEPLYRRREHRGQSTRQHPHARDRSAWFDPRLEGAITFPAWRRGAEYWRAAQRGPLSRRDRRAVMVQVGPWLWRYRSRLARELAWGLREHWRRSSLRGVRASGKLTSGPRL